MPRKHVVPEHAGYFEHLITLIFSYFNLSGPELLFFFILAHTVYKMGIIQEPNKVEL